MALRTCRVTGRDANGIVHSVEVTADSLYEAVGNALRAFQGTDWAADVQRSETAITVMVKQPEVEHKVRLRDFRTWLEAAPRSPAEMALKSRLRALLGE